MKEKKLLIALIVFTVAFGVYFGYRNLGKEKETVAYRKDNYTRLINMAKTSPRSGLAQMARALKKHYADKKFYPSKLKALYPDYIRSKAFIDEVDWNYSRRGNAFLLSKTVDLEGNSVTASIDESLRFDTGSKTMLAQSENERVQPSEPSLNVNKLEVRADTRRAAEIQKEGRKDSIQFDDFAINSSGKIAIDDNLQDIIDNDAQEAALKSFGKATLAVAEDRRDRKDHIVAGLDGRYLIWRDKDGHLGFSNIQYPEKTRCRTCIHWRELAAISKLE